MYTMQHIIQQLNQLAPPHLAEAWDNVGLLLGDSKSEVHRILCALDLNERVVEEAITKKVQAIVLHHPFIFKAIKKLDFGTSQGRMIQQLIKHDINVFAMHTNFDIATGGMNDYLAELFELKETCVLQETGQVKCVKVVIYVPQTHFELVRDKMIAWNPCKIGNYSGCTFMTEGEGTFCPEEGASPFIGEKHALEKVKEVKLEFMTYANQVQEMLEVLKTVHPYEEIAWDAFELSNQSEAYGLGRVGICAPIDVYAFIEKVKQIFNIPYVRVVGASPKQITRLAICSGSGASVIGSAVGRADILITGDVGFHDAQYAIDQGLIVLDVGHYASENIGMQHIKSYLESRLCDVEVMCSEVDGEVFQTL